MLNITLGGVIIGVVLGAGLLIWGGWALWRWFKSGYDIKLYGGQGDDE